MKKIIGIFFIISALIASGCGKIFQESNPDGGFIKFFGHAFEDEGIDIALADDNKGFFILGSLQAENKTTDIILIRTDQDGNEMWFRTFGDSLHSERASAITRNDDGSLVIVGSSLDIQNTETNIIFLKTDKDGNKLWDNQSSPELESSWQTFDSDKANQVAHCLARTSDGGYIIAGSSDRANPGNGNPAGKKDILMVKTNEKGIILWYKFHGGIGNDVAIDICQLENNDFIIAGNTNSFSENGQANTNAIAIRTNNNGVQKNKFTYGDKGTQTGNSITQLPDGTFLLVGSTMPEDKKNKDIYRVKLGKRLQESTELAPLGGEADDDGQMVRVTGNNILILGSTQSNQQANSDIYLILTDTSGEILWEKFYGDEGNEFGKSFTLTPEGKIAIIGSSVFQNNGMITLIQTGKNGKIIY